MVEMGALLVEEAKKAKVKHIVRLSVLGAGTVQIPIPRWHRQVEKLIEESGITYTFLRPNSFMQNFINFGYTIKNQGAFYLPSGDSKVSYVDVRDIAAVAVKALIQNGHENKAYDITGPEVLSNHEVAEILSEVTGKKINYINVSDDDARNGMKMMGMPDWLINALIELYKITRSGFGADVSPVVEQITGRNPISFNQFAKDYAEAFI
jgi:uncharacterized protein YbjT (DUF2867 family)